MTASTAKSMERYLSVSATATYGTGGGTGAETLPGQCTSLAAGEVGARNAW